MRVDIVEEYTIDSLAEFIVFNGYEEISKRIFDIGDNEEGYYTKVDMEDTKAIMEILDYIYQDRQEIYCLVERIGETDSIKIIKLAIVE